MFTFTPLLGAQSSTQAVQSLLELDGGIKILVDLGWDDDFDVERLREIEKQTPTISLILLTHPTIPHIGAYAHCCKHVPLFRRIPVYATTPVIALGRTLLQDLYESNPLAASTISRSFLSESGINYIPEDASDTSHILLPPPTAEEIDEYFAAISPLKYSQPHQPSSSSSIGPALTGLTITAYRAGHTLGGTIWHIQCSSESVVYAVDWNQARENVLSGAAWLGSAGGNEVIEQLRRPTTLICSARNGEIDAPTVSWTKRDDALLGLLREAIAADSKVLIPCDSPARSLELLYLLERSWTTDETRDLRRAKLYYASRTAGSTIRYARTMGEWMDEGLKQEFESVKGRADQRHPRSARTARSKRAEQPFDFDYVNVVERPQKLERAMAADGPSVFLASNDSADWGFSRSLLDSAAATGDLVVIFTSKIGKGEKTHGIGRSLMERAFEDPDTQSFSLEDVEDEIKLKSYQLSPLGTHESTIYQSFLAKQKEKGYAADDDQTSPLETNADVDEDASSSSSSEDEDGDDHYQGKVLNASAALNHSRNKLGLTDEELGINVLLRRRNVHDYDVRGRKGRERIFPYTARRRRNDEFGDLIRPEDFLRAEEREGATALALATQNNSTDSADIGAKRKWDFKIGDSKGASYGAKKSRTKGPARDDPAAGSESRQEMNNEESDDHNSSESEYEPAEPARSRPQKIVYGEESLRLRLKVAVVDYSAIHDKRALQMLLPLIKPRKLILTAGTPGETAGLAAECSKIFSQTSSAEGGSDVFTPENGTLIDASVDTNAWTIKLSQMLYQKLNWQMIDATHGIVTISGQLAAKPDDDSSVEESTAKRQKSDGGKSPAPASQERSLVQEMPTLDMLPASLAVATRTTQRLHVGDMKLPELRRLLQGQGLLAEFRGAGTLLVNGYVVVRKSGLGRIEVESLAPPISGVDSIRMRSSFHDVKAQIYSSLAVVSAR